MSSVNNPGLESFTKRIPSVYRHGSVKNKRS